MPKFADIPQYTRPAHYHINVPWSHLENTLDRWMLKESGIDPEQPPEQLTVPILNLDPDFQRAHVWTKKQQIAYVEFKLRGGSGAEVILFNCPRWMSWKVVDKDCYNEFVLVDGKQRIQAVLQFLRNKIKAFGHYYKEYEDKLGLEPMFIFTVNDLETKAEVLQWYLELNTGGVVHTKEEITKVKALLRAEKKK